MNCPTRDPEPTGNQWFNQNPPAFDKALTTRSSLVCGASGLEDEQYNLGLHVMALFVILCQSSLACAFPIIAKKFPRLRIPPSFLFSARHFGTGVLIATAFVHLLPTAFISLTDSCLPAFWNQKYPAMAGAIAMLAVFFVTGIEMLFTRGLCKGSFSGPGHHEATLELGCRNGAGSTTDEADEKEGGNPRFGGGAGAMAGVLRGGRGSGERQGSEEIDGAGGIGDIGFGMAGRRRNRSNSMSQGLQMYENIEKGKKEQSETVLGLSAGIRFKDSSDVIAQANECAIDDRGENRECGVEYERKEANEFHRNATAAAKHEHIPGISKNLTPQQAHKKALLQVALLEMGILFHSVFIGMALGVTGGSGFIVLLIAIAFHQTFEGLALGSRIALLQWKPRELQPWLMALTYGLTTPLGQAIGLATHTLYSPRSQTGLLMVGIMNAISSGLLVFAGLVELLAEDFLSDESWRALKGKRRLLACFLVFAGAFGMSFVGAFA